MSFSKKLDEKRVVLGPVRFAFVRVFEKRKNDDGTDGKYEVSVLIPKTDTRTLELVKNELERVKKEGATKKWGGKVPSGERMNPIHDGDDTTYEGYAGCMYFSARSDTKPSVLVKKQGEKAYDAFDEDDFYSGCWGLIEGSFYPYAADKSKGIGFGMNQVIKIKDDEKFSGSSVMSADEIDELLDDDLE